MPRKISPLTKLLTMTGFLVASYAWVHAQEESRSNCFQVDEVLKVVDGDTIDVRVKLLPFSLLNDIRIRMEGINAWESRTRDLEEKKLGMAAKKRLTELTQEKITVCLTERGKYGRWLGTLFSGETNINQQLIAEGHAHEYFGGKRKEFK